ncbi:hypothetical protein VF21_07422 [Pseudogymnoascus sp. 05NY08]|nr:hypothetical protein VF21_07422 [Pseudogymnoascus sp. 05NY08]
MPPNSKERRTRTTRGTAKTSSATGQADFPPLPTKTSGTIGGRVTKTPPKGKDKQTKSPKKAANNDPKNPETDEGNSGGNPEGKPEDTDTQGPFVNGGQDNFLKSSDIAVGNVISTGYHHAYTQRIWPDDVYRSRYVRESGDGCGDVHSKYRKFVIVALFKKHFVTLPIYSHRIASLQTRGDHNEYAEILDSTLKDFTPPRLPRPNPLCRGSIGNIWLWSKAKTIENRNWARMADTSVAWLARPVAHDNSTKAKVVSSLDKDSTERLLRWARDCLVDGLEANIREHLRVIKREDIKAPTVTGPGPWR